MLDEQEPLYRRVNKYLDIEDRVRILNKRLDIVNDLLDSLSSQLEIRNSHRQPPRPTEARQLSSALCLDAALCVLGSFVCPPAWRAGLEVIIILLITLEIALEVVKEAMLPPLATWPRKLLIAGGAALLVPWRRAIGRWV